MTVKIALLIVFSLFGLLLVNRYVFSWIGLFLNLVPNPTEPILEIKTISVRQPNGGAKRLSFVVNLPELRTAFGARSEYEIIYHSGHVTVYDGVLTLYRKFGRVWYFVSFDTRSKYDLAAKETKLVTEMKVGTGTPLHLWRRGELSVKGERPFVPSFIIMRRINRMIQDMPLTRGQKSEIRSCIKLGYETGINLTFF